MILHAALLAFYLSQVQVPAGDSSIFSKHKPFGSVLRTVRDSIRLTGDSTYQTLQIETTKAKRFDKIVVRFGIYQDGRKLFVDQWHASTYFDPKDNVPDSLKWRQLEYLMKVFFVNQNFTTSGDEPLSAILARAEAAGIEAGSPEAQEFESSPHRIFSVYGGRDHLYALTWLASKQEFVKVWKN